MSESPLAYWEQPLSYVVLDFFCRNPEWDILLGEMARERHEKNKVSEKNEEE